MVNQTPPVRLIPRWYAVLVVTLAGLGAGTFFGLSLSTVGAARCSAGVGGVAFALLLVSALSALVRPRRPREPTLTTAGTRVFRAPSLTVLPLLGAWLALLLLSVYWAFIALTDFTSLESPGFVLLTIGASLASVPDLVRLLTGRLHWWHLEIGEAAIVYRGYRTDVSWPWAKVHGARIQARGPAGIVVDVKGTGADPVVPFAAFAVPAEQLHAEISRQKSTSRG